jgi:DNA polymerase III subunit gamma/tau
LFSGGPRMSYLALYREWRPRTFDEVVEQKHAVYALRQAVISGQIGHAYLFSGTRGTGKTTLAKIFSRAINCLNPQDGNPCNQCEICRGVLDGSLLDVVEMDAASNNSVDNVRRMTDEVNFMPSQARYKVYIIDEVHMLTPGAFNALLKTLEEPPAHAVFILATTEPHRIPATILSRCQRYDFRRIPVESITTRLREIAVASGIAIDDSGLETIATFADGALRDAISLLDQTKMSCAGIVSRDDVLALAGLAKDDALLALAEALIQADAAAVLDQVDLLVMAGRDLARLIPDLAQLFRNLLVCQVSDRPEKLVQTTADGLATMKQLAQRASQDQLLNTIRGLSALLPDLRWATDSRTVLEVGLLRLMGDPAPATPTQPQQKILATPAARSVEPVAPASAPASEPRRAPAAPVVEQAPPPPDMPGQAVANEPDDIPLPEEPPPLEPLLRVTGPDPEIAAAPAAAPPAVKQAAKPVQPTTPAKPAQPQPAVLALPSEPEPSATAHGLDAPALWQKTLGKLSESGQMTLYLFGRQAQVSQAGPLKLRLDFSETEQIHYDEIRSAPSQKILRDVLKEITGQIYELDVRQAGRGAKVTSGDQDHPAEPAQDDRETVSGAAPGEPAVAPEEPDWISKLQATAETFGIPITMED